MYDLPNDYFDQTAALDPEGTGAAIYAFEHRFDPAPAVAQAARLYEISLRYNVLGLAWAGSPYAYQSMGSCVVISGNSYAAVRGFPRKNAAEDFYVLNKLAKVGSIFRLTGSPILLEGRPSDRVPFGTGRAIRDLVSKKRGLANFRLFHPLVFAHLAGWLDVLGAIDGLEWSPDGGEIAFASQAGPPAGSPRYRCPTRARWCGARSARRASPRRRR